MLKLAKVPTKRVTVMKLKRACWRACCLARCTYKTHTQPLCWTGRPVWRLQALLALLDVHLRTDLLFNVTRCIQQLLGATDAANRIKGDYLFYQMIPAPRQAPPLLPLSVHLQVAHHPLHLRACKDVGQKGYHWTAAKTAAASG